jgi:hypothetical protein
MMLMIIKVMNNKKYAYSKNSISMKISRKHNDNARETGINPSKCIICFLADTCHLLDVFSGFNLTLAPAAHLHAVCSYLFSY